MGGAPAVTLTFGTAGVRAPLGEGPDRMNDRTVTLVATAVARYLREHEPAGSTVIVGGDARHGSARFVGLVSEVVAGHGGVVVVPPEPVPTPVVAAAVRARSAAAGLVVTASHNPPGDNGIKVYGRGGAQIVPPTDSDIELHLRAAARGEGFYDDDTATSAHPHVFTAVAPSVGGEAAPELTAGSAGSIRVDPTLVDDYVAGLVAALPRPAHPPRVALTPVHGVGGEICRRVLADIGVHDVHLVPEQAEPDPDFPTVSSPNPERPETVSRLLGLAARIDADVALALDPDADRCAVGLRGPDGRWRMLDGDQTGAVLADHLLRSPLPGSADGAGTPGDSHSTGDSRAPVVASTIVSSRLASLLVPARGGRHVETLTGFKWLVRAGEPLRYAYEEAIGHCVLPDLVADKDGIATAGAWCAMVGSGGPTVAQRIAALDSEFGAHLRRNVTLPLSAGAGASADSGADVAATMDRAARTLTAVGDVRALDGTPGFRVDQAGARAVIRPSGTEPLLKTYVEAWTPPGPGPTDADRRDAERRLAGLADAVADAVATSVAGP